MPSFDIVSKIDQHELNNVIEQTNREIANRFDFKGTNSRVETEGASLVLHSSSKFQIKQADEIMRTRMSKRGIDLRCFAYGEVQERSKEAHQSITMKQGIDREMARKISKIIKDAKLKVQTGIQGDLVRVTGKKKDDLQSVIALLKGSKIDLPLQYVNFRE